MAFSASVSAMATSASTFWTPLRRLRRTSERTLATAIPDTRFPLCLRPDFAHKKNGAAVDPTVAPSYRKFHNLRHQSGQTASEKATI